MRSLSAKQVVSNKAHCAVGRRCIRVNFRELFHIKISTFDILDLYVCVCEKKKLLILLPAAQNLRFFPSDKQPLVMFKRLERKLKRKRKEEELGIDDDVKEVLGIYDMDSSDDSGSDSDSESSESSASSSSGGEGGSGGGWLGRGPLLEKRRKGRAVENRNDGDDEGEDDQDGDEEAGSADSNDIDEDEDEDEDELHVSIEEALHDPLHVVSIQPHIKACILCPGKLLKNQKMEEVHTISKVSSGNTHFLS
jgi:hypothetical protein